MSRTSLTELLRLTSPPVAITFVDAVPPGVPHVSAVEPAGCGYWRRAAGGEVFYTVADDHKHCPVGAHTHNVPLSPAEQQEQLMLLAEAAQAAGVAGTGATMGRPTCAVLPEALNSARTAVSFGCIGNRVYTGADDTEAYFAIPGPLLSAVEETLAVIVRANQELEKFHRGRAAAAPTA
jgi:uncharacterized protein (DUF169 family)